MLLPPAAQASAFPRPPSQGYCSRDCYVFLEPWPWAGPLTLHFFILGMYIVSGGKRRNFVFESINDKEILTKVHLFKEP